jgi:hypothetical protein
MKGIKLFFLGVMFALLVFSTFWAGNVYASTGCFTDTNGNWAETFICWMNDSGITTGVGGGYYDPDGYVTRAQMAVFMKRLANVPPESGDVYISTGPVSWVVNANTPTGFIDPYAGFSWLGAPSTGSFRYSLSPSLPSSLYNTRMYVKGVKICYDASYAGAYITTIEVKHFTYSTGGYSYVNTIYDYTDHTDVGCYTLNFTTPRGLKGNDQVSIDVVVTFTDSTDIVKVGVTTVILSPSAEAAVLENSEAVTPFMGDPSQDGAAAGK